MPHQVTSTREHPRRRPPGRQRLRPLPGQLPHGVPAHGGDAGIPAPREDQEYDVAARALRPGLPGFPHRTCGSRVPWDRLYSPTSGTFAVSGRCTALGLTNVALLQGLDRAGWNRRAGSCLGALWAQWRRMALAADRRATAPQRRVAGIAFSMSCDSSCRRPRQTPAARGKSMPTSSGDGCYEHCPVASALLTPTKSADDSHMPPPFRCSLLARTGRRGASRTARGAALRRRQSPARPMKILSQPPNDSLGGDGGTLCRAALAFRLTPALGRQVHLRQEQAERRQVDGRRGGGRPRAVVQHGPQAERTSLTSASQGWSGS